MINDSFCCFANGFDFFQDYMKIIYGERGCIKHNITRYVESEFFNDSCRVVKHDTEIPIISIEELEAVCAREKQFLKLSEKLVREYDYKLKNGSIIDEDYYNIGGILGVCPSNLTWNQVLYPFVLDLFVESDDEGQSIWENVQKNKEILKLLVDNLICAMRKGQVIDYYGRQIVSQGYVRNYFRGENAVYGSSRPSMFRNELNCYNEVTTRRIIASLQVTELALWIRSLDIISEWEIGDIFDSAIAQHYGLPTPHMDITGDIRTALFFACCKWKNNKWEPLTEEDIFEKSSREEVDKLGGDSRFAVLHIAPAVISTMSGIIKDDYYNITEVEPIGYQPFVRCSAQKGYIVRGNPQYDMYVDPAFSKVKFRLTSEFCKKIFDEMDGGDKIYPKEPFVDISIIVERIKASKKYSKDAFDLLMDYWNKSEVERKRILKEIEEAGYDITETIEPWCNEEEKKKICNEMNDKTFYPDEVYCKPMFAL